MSFRLTFQCDGLDRVQDLLDPLLEPVLLGSEGVLVLVGAGVELLGAVFDKVQPLAVDVVAVVVVVAVDAVCALEETAVANPVTCSAPGMTPATDSRSSVVTIRWVFIDFLLSSFFCFNVKSI